MERAAGGGTKGLREIKRKVNSVPLSVWMHSIVQERPSPDDL